MAKNSQKIVKSTSIRGLEETHSPGTDGTYKELFTSERGDISMDTLYSVVKQCPEVMACIQAITEDIMADEWKFIGKAEKNLNSAQEFASRINLYKILSNAIYDLLITGNAYLLKLSVREEDAKSLMTVLTKEMALTYNVRFRKQIDILMQKLTGLPEDLQLLKSSTVKINFDETGKVASYIQEVKGEKRVYMPQDIVHLSLINIGGEPYGFAGLEPLLADVATLIFAKSYVGNFFENDGVPNFLFQMPEDNPDSRNFELLKKELAELKKKSEKFRNMVVTGNVQVQQLQKFNKDMEFSKLIEHFTQIVLIAMGVPTHRINYTLTDTQSGSQVNRAYEGYYKKISFIQRLIENSLNKDLFSKIKVDLIFNRAYKVDEMREAQIVQILSQIGVLTVGEIREKMGYDPEIPKDSQMPISTGDQNNINFNADQRTQQGRDNNAKRPDAKLDNKLKSLDNCLDVSFEEFVTIVEKYVGTGNFDNAKLVYNETPEAFLIYFNDGSWKYRAIVQKKDLDVEKFKFEKLRNAVKILY